MTGCSRAVGASRADLDQGLTPSAPLTLAKYLPEWLEASRQRIRPATGRAYRQAIELTQIGFGKSGGRNWVGFSGSVHLVEQISLGYETAKLLSAGIVFGFNFGCRSSQRIWIPSLSRAWPSPWHSPVVSGCATRGGMA